MLVMKVGVSILNVTRFDLAKNRKYQLADKYCPKFGMRT